ncbi:hypothetical protein RchiOBHm_Chr6g0283221 [Rosa chinensis]|uniref:Uncharacterized protein n=1 Tax=Rosa chinensis TaxID=74649 RepID=A0A2P6PTY3_ROSCH|nr:hypothetical protein RchiOBHm_Chr6g0283221 [Rosa chinensis]
MISQLDYTMIENLLYQFVHFPYFVVWDFGNSNLFIWDRLVHDKGKFVYFYFWMKHEPKIYELGYFNRVKFES